MAAVTPCRFTYRFFDRIGSDGLVGIRQTIEAVLDDRARQPNLFEPPQSRLQLVPAPDTAVVKVAQPAQPREELGEVLSPTQVRTFLDCSARWWFRYGLHLPEPKTGSLALGSAVHRALEVNFRQKIETKEDLETAGMVALFRGAWAQETEQAEFRDDENPEELCNTGERLVRKYMEEAAPEIEPSAVELPVVGEIAGVPVRGRVDLLDTEGRLVDVKTAARKPSGIAPEHAFQLATYRQITPGASGQARLDTLVKTKAVQLVQQSYTVGEPDVLATRTLYPLVQTGIRTGLYFPNRQSLLCSRRNCAFWRSCEREFGGAVSES